MNLDDRLLERLRRHEELYRVGSTQVGIYWISTIWLFDLLGYDDQQYETAIFKEVDGDRTGELIEVVQRYGSRYEALLGHLSWSSPIQLARALP